MEKENTVKVYMRSGTDKRLVCETEMRLFRANMRIHRRAERCQVVLATPEGGAEIDMPREFTKDMVLDLMFMMEQEDTEIWV
jgi:hypothetical protein